MQVKICGIRTLDDALAAADAGADMLGFNFYRQGARYIPPAGCEQTVGRLRARGYTCTLVGVFVNEPVEEVRKILQSCGLDLAQLHGDEPPAVVRALHPWAVKAVRPASRAEAEVALSCYCRPDAAPALVLDTALSGYYGGTGRPADWELARMVARYCPLLLAGGLQPGNVADAVHTVRPWGVDVASGVEDSAGRKDPARMAAFVDAVRAAALLGDPPVMDPAGAAARPGGHHRPQSA